MMSSLAHTTSGGDPASLTHLDEAEPSRAHWRWAEIAALGDYWDLLLHALTGVKG
jgi:hypothetical protein